MIARPEVPSSAIMTLSFKAEIGGIVFHDRGALTDVYLPILRDADTLSTEHPRADFSTPTARFGFTARAQSVTAL